MTNFESMDNINTNFVALSEQELVETDGGYDMWGVGVGGENYIIIMA